MSTPRWSRFVNAFRSDGSAPLYGRGCAVFRACLVGFLLLGLLPAALHAHNLDQRDTAIVFDDDFVDLMAARAGLGQSLVQVGDEIWLVLKSTPGPGTLTGVGGYLTFYVPTNEVEVIEAAYLTPTPGTPSSVHNPANFTSIPVKGQSIIAIGSGPIAPATTVALTGLRLTNAFGQAENTVTAAGLHRGTIAGVYADTGIFFSQDPRTAWQSWSNAPATGPLSRRGYPVSMVNNRGETIVPITRYDAEQLIAYGRKDVAPVVDPNGRGNTPWGLGNVVSGPDSGYAWNFDLNTWLDTTNMQNAVDDIGPWQRIKYPGSQYARDQAGLISSALGFAGEDASTVGFALGDHAGETNLPGNANAVRFSYGMLELGRPEYAAIKVRVKSSPSTECFTLYTDAFGGDAGGEQGGKDHEWRYYDPTIASLSTCVYLSKVASDPIVKPGEPFYYTLTFANTGGQSLPNVTLTDTLPAGIAFLSSVPAQSSGPNPLVWNLGTVQSNSVRQITVYVKATSVGTFLNTVVATSGTNVIGKADETVEVSYKALLRPVKTVSPADCAEAGGTVTYTLQVLNEGTGPNGTPLVVRDYLPPGFTFGALQSATLNGASLPLGSVAVNSSVPSTPTFTVSQSILADRSLVLVFTANISPTQAVGTYYNEVQLSFESKIVSGAPTAPVTVCGGKIGDTVFRDWNGNGTQDVGEEGLPGVTVSLYYDADTNGVYETFIGTQVTDASGYYLFSSLTEGNYQIAVPAPGTGGVPSAYTLTADPDGAPATTNFSLTLATNEEYLAADFGYHPAGTGAIGDTVYNDKNGDGLVNGTDVGISNVTVILYEDSNANGLLDAGDLAVATTNTGVGGLYSFTGLATNLSYLVDVDETDPDFTGFFSPNSFVATTPALQAVPGLTGTYNNADFGYVANLPSSIGDTVFIDVDGNGTNDVGSDIPLPNVTVTIYRDSNGDGVADGPALATDVTDSSGQYLFGGLPPDTYLVVVDTADPDLPSGLGATVSQYIVPLPASTNHLTADFPFRQFIDKTVDKAFAPLGTTVTFSVRTYYAGCDALENVRVVDPIPSGVTYVASSANAGGTYGAYIPLAAKPGVDVDASLTNRITVGPSYVLAGGQVTVTQNVWSPLAVANVSPSLLQVSGGAYTILSGPTPQTNNVPAGGTGINFVWTVLLADVGEYTFSAGALDATETTSWPDAVSASVFSSPGGGPNVVTWNLGTTTPGILGEVLTSGYLAGVYGFRGGNTKEFSKYSIVGDSWSTRSQPSNGIEKGGSLTTDGNGTIWALEGKSKWFYSYSVESNLWTRRADTSDNANEGGALQFLKVNGTNFVFALLGNSNRFRRYDVAANTWANMANVPVTVKKGGALTTDGTYLYAFQGDLKKLFYRYDPIANTWLAMAPFPVNVGWGGSLTRVGGYLYAMQGDGKRGFYSYNIASNTWTALALTPGNVGDGGALTTDGTYIYAFQGKTKVFWRYDISANSWSTLPAVNFLGNVGQGGALVYHPASAPVGRWTSLRACPALVSTGDTIRVVMELRSSSAASGVVPSMPTVTGIGGATATLLSGPSPASTNVATNATATFTWLYRAVPGSTTGTVTFTAYASNGVSLFTNATSQSVLVSPILQFQGTVTNPLPASGVIENTAVLSESSGNLGSVVSPTTETATDASIGDRVWVDLDGDGVQDAGEPGIPGVTVWLYLDPDNNGIIDAGETQRVATVTDAEGLYHFYGVLPGTNYTVTYDYTTVPAGYLPTTDGDADAGKTVHDVGPITSGLQYVAADFGLQPAGAASIGDTVWLDADNDGMLDAGEAGLTNITIRLYFDANTNGVVDSSDFLLQTTSTDTNGNYLFDGLTTNAYLVQVDGASLVPSPYDGSSALSNAMSLVSGTDPHAVTLTTTNQTYADADFGYNWSGAIGDYVWWDDNRDGIPNGGELPVTNAYVILYHDANSNGILDVVNGDYEIDAMSVDTNGYYRFANLPPGPYLVDVYEDSIGNDGPISTTPNVRYINLGAGETNLTADFGYYIGARVEGNVFWDENRNLIFDGSELGLSNVTVYLTGFDEFANPISMTNVTDADGHFFFVVPEGDYTLTYSSSDVLALDPTLSDTTTVTSFSFHAYPGESWVHPPFDFGVDNSGRIGDTIFGDIDTNGVQNLGEPGLADVSVYLYLDSDGNGTGDTLLDVQATDATGFYQFVGLADTTGSVKYLVQVATNTLPAGYLVIPTADPDLTMDSLYSTVLTNGETIAIVDFGYPPLPDEVYYTVSGTVWNDGGAGGGVMTNAVQDGAEAGFSNVTLTVSVDIDNDGTNDVVYVVATDTNGYYSVAGIPSNSTVRIAVNEGTLPNAAYEITPGMTNVLTVSNISADTPDQDFGYYANYGAISGTVVSDGSGNGFADVGEPPVSNVTVTLTYAGPDGIPGTEDDVVYTTVTDANGDYAFTNLLPGIYQVTQSNPYGYLDLADADGGNPNNISVSLAAGQVVTDRDFELYRPASVGDRVWLDEDGDGLQDAGEAGIANVVVELRSTTDVLIASTTTDSEGRYLFTELVSGTYVVRVDTNTLAAGLAANPTYDPDATTNHQTTVTLVTGQDYREADFGYNWVPPTDTRNGTGTGAIGDRVWIDANGDGVQDPGEAGLPGVEVVLYVDSNGDGTYDQAVATNTTDASGQYMFDELVAGAYVVVVNGGAAPAGYTATGDRDGIYDNRTTTPILLAPGDVYVNADFGYQPAASSTIGDRVWFDADADGAQDGGEPGIAGVSVALLDGSGVVIATTLTDTNGLYTFTGLPAGTYTVWVNDVAGLTVGMTQTGDPDLTRDGRHTLTVDGTSTYLDNDFGYTGEGQRSGRGLIGDTIYLDLNTNGVFDAGEGLEGIAVGLYDTNGVLLASATTDAKGLYAFGGLNTNGATYVVRVDTNTLPAGVTNSIDPDGGTANESTVVLTGAAPVNLLQDFGYQAVMPNTIEGTLWVDLNGDGTLAEGESNRLAGITVALLDTNGNVVATTVTDANGDYRFPGLPDGTYRVDVMDDANLLNGWWHSDGANDGADSNSQDDAYTVSVSGGETDRTGDFGYFIEAAAVGNRIWFDDNGDGLQGTNEVGLAGVRVKLTVVYANGTTTEVYTVSGASGDYTFGNLLLDESYLTNAPYYSASVAVIPNGYFPVPKYVGTNAWVDSGNIFGQPLTAARGVTDVGLQADPNDEPLQGSYDFGFDNAPTLAVISGFRAYTAGGRTWVQWETAAEVGTVGYYLDRLTVDGWAGVNPELLLANETDPLPHVYEVEDAGVASGETHTWRIVELDDRGRLNIYGPYTVTVDGIGISYEAWAEERFGDAGALEAERGADPDGDGLTNFEEYLAGTDPKDRNSVLRVTGVESRPAVGETVLRWGSEAGRAYTVEFSTDLLGGFLPVESGIPAMPPDNVHTVRLESASGMLYFRVLVE